MTSGFRISGLRVQMQRGKSFVFTFDGANITAYPGETIAGALLAADVRSFRQTAETGAPRGPFCGMGVCYDCLIEVEGQGTLRACMTEAEPGLSVSRAGGAGK